MIDISKGFQVSTRSYVPSDFFLTRPLRKVRHFFPLSTALFASLWLAFVSILKTDPPIPLLILSASLFLLFSFNLSVPFSLDQSHSLHETSCSLSYISFPFRRLHIPSTPQQKVRPLNSDKRTLKDLISQ